MFDHGWTVDSVRPIFKTCLAHFGPERLMFGSNFPVCSLSSTYPSLIERHTALTEGLSEEAQTLTGAIQPPPFTDLGPFDPPFLHTPLAPEDQGQVDRLLLSSFGVDRLNLPSYALRQGPPRSPVLGGTLARGAGAGMFTVLAG